MLQICQYLLRKNNGAPQSPDTVQNTNYTTVSMFGISTLRNYQLCHIFDIPWLLQTNQADITSLASRLPLLSRYCLDQHQLRQALLFIHQDDCFRAVWNAAPLQSFNECRASKSRYDLLQITVLALCTVQSYLVFLLLLYPTFWHQMPLYIANEFRSSWRFWLAPLITDIHNLHVLFCELLSCRR